MRQMMVATVCLMLVLAAAFVAADATRSTAIFSLSPPPPKHEPGRVMPPDVTEANRLDLHRTFFTAWAALLLATPALCLFPFRRSSPAAAGYWWALDVVLAWTVRAENLPIKIERTISHLLAAALFILGSAKEGEIWLSKALGFTMAGAIAIALI